MAGVRLIVALILVVDDEPGTRSHACQVLEDVGYTTVAAASANEAREVLGLTHPDLMVLDLRLPDASGLELALQFLPRPYTVPRLLDSVRKLLNSRPQ